MPLISILLDENIPDRVAHWLRKHRPNWRVNHVVEIGLMGQPDEQVFAWAQEQRAIVITYDEDFSDRRFLREQQHCGVIRLRVYPTTQEQTQWALERLFDEVAEEDLSGALIIVDSKRTRIRRPHVLAQELIIQDF